ncbi:MAG: terpene cyclase/mutase family protein, partial [Dehalococcoidia bacterium]|nr:terpene cyclase/mutase family protein [Dehalococcoidia bacterium]
MKWNFTQKLLSVLLVFTFLLPTLFATPVLAAGPYPLTTSDAEVADALNYLHTQQGTDGGIGDFGTSAWAVMAIAAAEEDPHSWKVNSNPTIVDYLETNADSASSTNDYSRMILAIAAADEDVTDFGGVDFLSELQDAYDGSQIGDSSLLNDDFWGVMALVAAGEDPASTIIQDSVSFILSNQGGDGGWSWGVGQASDADDTAAAIMALIAAGQSASSTAITDALAYIKSTQMDNGGFESWGSTNSATDSWGIDGIVAAGDDPTSSGWQSGLGNDPVDDLLTFQNPDGSFNWT